MSEIHPLAKTFTPLFVSHSPDSCYQVVFRLFLLADNVLLGLGKVDLVVALQSLFHLFFCVLPLLPVVVPGDKELAVETAFVVLVEKEDFLLNGGQLHRFVDSEDDYDSGDSFLESLNSFFIVLLEFVFRKCQKRIHLNFRNV